MYFVYFAVGLADKCAKDAEVGSTAEHAKCAEVNFKYEAGGTGGSSLGMNARCEVVFSRISCVSWLIVPTSSVRWF